MSDRPVTSVEKRAIRAFLAMEAHVSDCWTCRKVEPAFHDAIGRDDMDEARRLAPQFCADMNHLAEAFELACRLAFEVRK